MAKDKSSFVLYADQKFIFSCLTDAEAGKLIKHIFAYVTDENPVAPTREIEIAFESIKQQFKRDLRKWEKTITKRSEAGKLGAEKRWEKKPVIVEPVKDMFSTEQCGEIAMRDPRWVKANNVNQKEIEKFNTYLEKLGIYEDNPANYKSYFSKLKGKYPDLVLSEGKRMVI